jgi:malate/lactate dehydrogenase
VLVVCAAPPEDPSDDRRAFLEGNLALLRQIAPSITAAAGSSGMVVLVTNPLDIPAEATRRFTGLPAHRIVGYSLNDSIRFRVALGRELDVPPRHVVAWVLGEHGHGQVPLFSRIRIDGQAVELDAAARMRVRDDTDAWFPRWARLAPGRSSGWTTPLGLVHMLQTILDGETLPAVVAANGAYGLPDTYLTLPARLSRHGAAGVEQWALDAAARVRGSFTAAPAGSSVAVPETA